MARKKRIIEAGGKWLQQLLNNASAVSASDLSGEQQQWVEIFKSLYLFDKESPYVELSKGLLAKAGLHSTEGIFPALVSLGIWHTDENTDLYRFDIRTDFNREVRQQAQKIALAREDSGSKILVQPQRRDLTHWALMTIDSQSTQDFDDALSLVAHDTHYELGIHIADVGEVLEKGDLVDQEARFRASSIYMPDNKISMLPTTLAEGCCSLKAGQIRPVITTLVKLSPLFDIMETDVFPSWVKVRHQYSYFDVNTMAATDPTIQTLVDAARSFRRRRLDDDAVQITLPEINLWVNGDGHISVSQTNRESPARMLVAELMIMTNWITARFLNQHQMPAVFRSQSGPKERLFKGDQGSVFQNWMQRKLLSRFVLGTEPEPHSGLGLDMYVTATSPIRKYYDLVTQRQVRAALGLEAPYGLNEIEAIIRTVQESMERVGRVQFNRHRYWLLKHLQSRQGKTEEAIVLYKKRNSYLILLRDYMIECDLPLSAGSNLKPEDYVSVKIQYVSARRNILTVFQGS